MKVKSKSICVGCGAEWIEGKGFIQEHYWHCVNARYGWLFTVEVPIYYVRPKELRLPKIDELLSLDKLSD